MLRSAGFAFILLPTAAAWGSELPRYDVEATCQAAPTLQGSTENTVRNCIRDEMQARTQLGRQWPGFDARRRNECIQEASLGGTPSYVALLTCLQM
ncbi:UNVERIFIED_ORG: hypothetical protein J2W74_000854 [Methylorubrum zatmanii]|nr:hypothetical protein ASF59_23235 [Methylobacterium sp. Leaf121]